LIFKVRKGCFCGKPKQAGKKKKKKKKEKKKKKKKRRNISQLKDDCRVYNAGAGRRKAKGGGATEMG